VTVNDGWLRFLQGGEQWNDYTGNFTLTSACIRVMNDMDMKVLLVTEIRRGVEGGAAPPMNPTLEIFTNMTNVDIQSGTLTASARCMSPLLCNFGQVMVTPARD
jgi:hypothetical protein